MALLLSTVTPYGSSGEYWKVVHCFLDALHQEATVATALFVNQDMRLLVKEPLVVRQDKFTYAPFVGEANAVAVAYAQLKLLPDFSQATDA